jgi:hypothetical protein
VPAVTLYAAGIPVRVPSPITFAIHKALVAGRRSEAAKRVKDIAQAVEIFTVLRATDAALFADRIAAARRRGPAWRTGIDAVLKRSAKSPHRQPIDLLT